MKQYLPILILLLPALGCGLFPCHNSSPCSAEYHAVNFDIRSMPRVLLMPLANETPFLAAGEDIRKALAAEFQCLGMFEVVMAPPNPAECDAKLVHTTGRFNEADLVRLAREFRTDGILVGVVTQYHPYPPPRIGLTLHLISASRGVEVASVQGIWDARDRRLAEEAKIYFRKTIFPRLNPSQESDVGLESPLLYARFVCNQAAQALVSPGPSPIVPANMLGSEQSNQTAPGAGTGASASAAKPTTGTSPESKPGPTANKDAAAKPDPAANKGEAAKPANPAASGEPADGPMPSCWPGSRVLNWLLNHRGQEPERGQ
jgi:hypothetical protein